MKAGRATLSVGNWQPGRVAAGAADLEFVNAAASHIPQGCSVGRALCPLGKRAHFSPIRCSDTRRTTRRAFGLSTFFTIPTRGRRTARLNVGAAALGSNGVRIAPHGGRLKLQRAGRCPVSRGPVIGRQQRTHDYAPVGVSELLTGGRSALRISLRRQAAKHAAQDFSKSFGLSAPHGVGLRHARILRSPDVPNPRIDLTFKEKNDERRR